MFNPFMFDLDTIPRMKTQCITQPQNTLIIYGFVFKQSCKIQSSDGNSDVFDQVDEMSNAHTSKDSDYSALFDKFEENMGPGTAENSSSALDWSCIFEEFEKEEEHWSALFEEFEAIYQGASKRLLGLFCLSVKRIM